MTLRALSIAGTGAGALLRQVDLMAGNLAGVAVPGFRRSRAAFEDLSYRGGRGTGIRLEKIDTMLDAGALQPTGRDLDLAIDGEGFFRVLRPDGSAAFTRAGNFRLDEGGALVSSEGYAIDPPLVVPPGLSKVLVDPSGRVSGFDPHSSESMQTLGQIEITRFASPEGLDRSGPNLFVSAPSAGEPTRGLPGEGCGTIRQGFLEQSNVDPMRELAGLLRAERALELNLSVMRAADEILSSINSLRRKP